MTARWPEGDIRERERLMLAAAQAGDVECEWYPMTIAGRLVVYVMADALRWEQSGELVRGSVSARLASDLALEMASVLPTTVLVDLMWHNATVRVTPHPQPISALTSAVVRHSRAIDEERGLVTGLVTGWKHWCLTRAHLTTDRATNYGWHVPGQQNPWRGIKTYPSETRDYRVIQPAAQAHGKWHTDYSQLCQLVRRDCTFDGKDDDLHRILTHPTLNALVSNEGMLPLQSTRQRRDTEPCVAELPRASIFPIRGRK